MTALSQKDGTGRRAEFAARALLFGVAWWALTEGAPDWDALAIGTPVVILAAALSTALSSPTGWSWLGALRFAGFFLLESWRGAVDVARRAFHPRMPLAPGFLRHDFRVQTELARVAVANVSSLFPGSLAVDIDDVGVRLHMLDVSRPDSVAVIASIENRVASMLEPAARKRNDVAGEGP